MKRKIYLLLSKYEGRCQKISYKYSPYTNVIGLSRSILALGTLLTLLLNPIYFLINKTNEGKYYNPFLNLDKFGYNKFNFFLIFGVENAEVMKFIAVIILIIVISGYFIKISSILHWWICLSFMFCSSLIDGGDQIASILTLLLLPITLTDKRQNHWKKDVNNTTNKINLLAIVAVCLIRIQVAIIYFDAAVGKMSVNEWKNGTALYYWLNNSVFGYTAFWKPILDPILSNQILLPFLTYGVLIFELMLFLAMFATLKYRRRILPFGILFHFLIILFHGIFSFFFSISAALIIYLYPTYRNFKIK
jgi:antimicrobial peptide system SdpB family protein